MTAPNRETSLLWYAIHTHAKQEDRAESNLRSWHVETFAPKYRSQRRQPSGPGRTPFVKHLFPCYIFARFNAQEMSHKIRFTRGVRSIVSVGDGPAPIEDELIEMIMSRRQEDGLIRLEDGIKRGDPVLVRAGSFKGLTGVFERRVKDSDRVMILLEAVNKQFHLTIPQSDITRLTAWQ